MPLTRRKNADVWLAIGQSNMDGESTAGTTRTGTDYDSQILLWEFAGSYDPSSPSTIDRDSGGWVTYENAVGYFDPSYGFARTMAKAQLDRSIAIIKVAFRGRPLRDFSSIDDEGYWVEVQAQVNAALAALTAQGIGYRVVGQITLGHTNDAKTGQAQSIYVQHLQRQWDDYIRLWGGDARTWRLALADHPASWTIYPTGAPAIRAAISEFAAMHPNQITVASTADTNHVGDEVHYDGESKELVGIRMANQQLGL